MQSAAEKVTYWIQRADRWSTRDSGPVTVEEARALLREHDWNAEHDYQRELETANKDSCSPGIGFVVADAGLCLHILPNRDGTAQCILWDEDKLRTWERDGASSAEQDEYLELFYRSDYPSVVRGWKEGVIDDFNEEADTSTRDEWLRLIREIRARRGQPSELTDEEHNLSERDAYSLYRSEAEREAAERHRAETIKAARSGRNRILVVAACGALLLSLLYLGVLQAWLSERLITDLWGWSVMMTAGGLVVSGLLQLQLRALRIATPWARGLSHAANILVGSVMGVAGILAVALFLVFAGMLLLGPGGGYTEKHFFIAVGVTSGTMIAVALLCAYLGYRSYPDGPEHETALELVGLAIFPFLLVGLGVNFLALAVIVSAISLQAGWIDANMSLALKITTAATACTVAIASWLGRKKNSVRARQGLATALIALALLAAVQALQALGTVEERPHIGPTIITWTSRPVAIRARR